MTGEQLILVAVVAVWALAIGLVTFALHRRLRRAPIVVQLTLVVVATVTVVIAGVISASQAMVLSSEAGTTLVLVVLEASAMAVLLTLAVARSMSRYTSRLIRNARLIGLGRTVSADPRGSTELTALAEALRETSEQLELSRRSEERLDAARRELISWISHDLRTPLASVKAMTEALQDGVAHDDATYHRKILAQTDQMAGLVNDLLELSNIQSGSLAVHTQRLDLYDLVSDAMADLSALARSQRISVDGRATVSAVIDADGALIGRVIRNLIVNAMTYSPAGSTIRIATSTTGRSAVIEVGDECGGIDRAHLDRLFETGWRASSERSASPYTGAGIGLATVAGIVSAHGGSVHVRNEGPGCVFAVCLPRTAVTSSDVPDAVAQDRRGA